MCRQATDTEAARFLDTVEPNVGSFFRASASVCLFAEREQSASAAEHVSELRKKAERSETKRKGFGHGGFMDFGQLCRDGGRREFFVQSC